MLLPNSASMSLKEVVSLFQRELQLHIQHLQELRQTIQSYSVKEQLVRNLRNLTISD